MIPENFTLQDLDNISISDPEDPGHITAMRLGLMCSFYMREPQAEQTRKALAQCGQQYLDLVKDNLKSYISLDSQGRIKTYRYGDANLIDYESQINDPHASDLIAEFYGDSDPYKACSYGLLLYASAGSDEILGHLPAYFSAYFPFSWLQNKPGQGAFQTLIQQWCDVLNPFHGYAGIGALQSVDANEKKRTMRLLYPMAQRFPGIEIDSPSVVASKAARGGGPLRIKGVNWLTAIDDIALAEIGGRETLLAQLGDGFKIHPYQGGVLIQAGATPQPGDRNIPHIPQYYQQLSQILKPLRMEFPPGHSLLVSPNRAELSNTEATNNWLARFD